MTKTGEKEFETKIYYISNHLLNDLEVLSQDIVNRGNFQTWTNNQLSALDLNDEKSFKWFEERMNELIAWDKRVLKNVKQAVDDINLITEMMKKLSNYYKYWPFAVTVNSSVSLFSTGRFKGDLKSAWRFFRDQLTTDFHVLKRAKEGRHKTAKFWFKTSLLHHGLPYGFTPYVIHLTIPRHEFRMNVLKAIAKKRVFQLQSILAKEDNYYKAQKVYGHAKRAVSA